ncbi:MAG TPA: hypothetical protein VF868_13605 [Bacteroidia bacterium]|jgi:hypothetical protein
MFNKLNSLFLFLFSFSTCLISNAQEDTKMTLPSSPAFSILDFEPSSVMKPTSNKELGADLLNSFDKDGKLLTNIGMEVSPYWLKSHPELSRKQYFDPGMMQCILQSFNISAGTVKDTSTGNNKLGVGFRFKLYNGNPTEESLLAETKLIAAMPLTNIVSGCIGMISAGLINSKDMAIADVVEGLEAEKVDKAEIIRFKQLCEELGKDYESTREGLISFLKAINAKFGDENKTQASKVAELSRNRVGFVVELAGASAFVNSRSNQPIERSGLWLNVSNYFSSRDAFTFTARYLFASVDSAVSNTDVGISYVKEISGFNFSLEAMFRWYRAEVPDININNGIITRLEKGNTYRISAQGSYKIAQNISVNISLGKDFDSPFISNTNFFTLIGVNYSVFKPQKVDPSKRD